MAWTDNSRHCTYDITIVDRNGKQLNTLEGFVSGSLHFGYETELRRAGTLQTRNDNIEDWPFAMLRIVINSGLGDSYDLGVYVINDCKEKTTTTGVVIKDYDLGSIASKAKTSGVRYYNKFLGTIRLWDLLGRSGADDGIVHYSATGGVESLTHTYGGDGYEVEAGTSALEVLSKACSDYGVHYSAKNYFIQVEPYINPKTKESLFTFTHKNGTIVSGDVEVTLDRYTTINRAIVTYSHTENDVETHIVGIADAPSSSEVAVGKREQYVSNTWNENDMSPATQDEANRRAQKHLEASSNPDVRIKFNSFFLGLCEGDCVTYVDRKESVHKGYVHDMDLELTPGAPVTYEIKKVVN